MVWQLDRLGRSMTHLVETVTVLGDRRVGFRSLAEGVDTTTTGGTLVFHLFGALAQFERDLIVERTQAGLKAATMRGRKPVVTHKKLEQASPYQRWIDRLRGRSAPQKKLAIPASTKLSETRNPTKVADVSEMFARAEQ